MHIQTQQIKNTAEKHSPKELVWHDIQGTHLELSNFLKTLSIQEKILEIVTEKRHFPEAKIFSSCIMLRLPVRNTLCLSKSSYVTFLVFPHQLITFHNDHIQLFTQINEKFNQDDDLDEYSITSLTTYIIDSMVELNIHCLTSARLATENLGNKLDVFSTSTLITEKDVINTRRRISRLLSQFEDQFYALTSLRTTQHTKKSVLLDALCSSIKETTEAQGHLHLEIRLRDIQQSYQYIMERKTEQRLRLLTILSTIYMPLTLITGIYGMNFTYMPELSFKYAYYITIAVMIILTSAQLIFFYYKGWFK